LRVIFSRAAFQIHGAFISTEERFYAYPILEATTQGPVITGTFNARALYKALIMNHDNARQFRAYPRAELPNCAIVM
jgi:hypothetical protein